MPVQPYSPPATETQTVTACYATLQYSLITILKELVKAKQTHWQTKKAHLTQSNQGVTPQMVVLTKLTITPKIVPIKANSLGKKTVCFITKPATKPAAMNPTTTKAVASVWNPTPIIATIDTQDDNYCEHFCRDEVTLTENKISHLFWDTSSEDEIDIGWCQSQLQALQVESSFPQTSANVMQIWANDKRSKNLLVKVAGMRAAALYGTWTNMSCMAYIGMLN